MREDQYDLIFAAYWNRLKKRNPPNYRKAALATIPWLAAIFLISFLLGFWGLLITVPLSVVMGSYIESLLSPVRNTSETERDSVFDEVVNDMKDIGRLL